MTAISPGRTLTIFAVGFLALDGVLMILAGLWSSSTGLVIWGAVFLAGAAGTVWLYRKHVEFLDGLKNANREMRRDIEEIKELMKDTEAGDE